MIYSGERELLFIKTRKTAGTSIEIALSANCGRDDVVTPISFDDEMRRFVSGFQTATNWATGKFYEHIYTMCLQLARPGFPRASGEFGKWRSRARWLYARNLANGATRLRRNHRAIRFRNHMRPCEIRGRMGTGLFDAAYKLTVVRHPYEQLLSEARWKVGDNDARVVSRKVDALLDAGKNNVGHYFVDGEMVIDEFIRFESMHEDLARLERRFDLVLIRNLPVTKNVKKGSRDPAHRILTTEQKRKCLANNAFEFERFGYPTHLVGE